MLAPISFSEGTFISQHVLLETGANFIVRDYRDCFQ
jgi:hypothetical protein